MSNLFEGEQAEALTNNLWSYVLKTQNKSDEQLASIFKNEDGTLNTDALDVLLQNNSDHVESLRGERKDKFNEGHSKGKKETLDKVEEYLRSKFATDSTSTWETLVDEIVGTEITKVKADFESKQVTDLDVQNSDLYKVLESNFENSNQEWQKKFDTRDLEIRKAETSQKSKAFAAKIIAELNPVFDTDPKRAENQKQDLYAKIATRNWKEESDGKMVLVDDEGLHLKNPQGHRIDPIEVIKGVVTSYYSLRVNDPHNPITNAGGGDPAQPGNKAAKNEKEYFEMLKNAKTPEEKREIKTATRKTEWYLEQHN